MQVRVLPHQRGGSPHTWVASSSLPGIRFGGCQVFTCPPFADVLGSRRAAIRTVGELMRRWLTCLRGVNTLVVATMLVSGQPVNHRRGLPEVLSLLPLSRLALGVGVRPLRYQRGIKLLPERRQHMARMLGFEVAGSACCRPHTKGHVRRNGSPRAAEKRVTQKWLDEYENRPEDEARACPKGGLSCRCGWPNEVDP